MWNWFKNCSRGIEVFYDLKKSRVLKLDQKYTTKITLAYWKCLTSYKSIAELKFMWFLFIFAWHLNSLQIHSLTALSPSPNWNITLLWTPFMLARSWDCWYSPICMRYDWCVLYVAHKFVHTCTCHLADEWSKLTEILLGSELYTVLTLLHFTQAPSLLLICFFFPCLCKLSKF